jgi:hypothetical protein
MAADHVRPVAHPRQHDRTLSLLRLAGRRGRERGDVEAVKVLGPTRAMFFQFLVPAFAVVLAALFLGEVIVLGQVVGGVVIVLGILVSRSRLLAASVG